MVLRWLVLAAVAFCELGYFLAKVSSCGWAAAPRRAADGAQLRLLLVSDMHVLGVRRRLWIERAWVDWQLRKSFALLSWAAAPHAVLVLGDMLDEGGGFTDDATWRAYRRRYGTAFHADTRAGAPPWLHVVGNHDTGWGGNLSPWLVQRFERSFGAADAAVAMRPDGALAATAEYALGAAQPGQGGGAVAQRLALERVVAAAEAAGGFVVVRMNSMALHRAAPRALQQHTRRFLRDVGTAMARRRAAEEGGAAPPLVLLSHMPLFRPDDRECGAARAAEAGHVTYPAPEEPLGEDAVAEEDTRWVLRTLRPALVLSGHTHTACFYVHEGEGATAGSAAQAQHRRWRGDGEWAGAGAAQAEADVPELTASSFGWGMRPDPAFALLSLSRGAAAQGSASASVAARVCALPDERVIFAVYGCAALSCLCVGLVRWLRGHKGRPPLSVGPKQH